MREIQV